MNQLETAKTLISDIRRGYNVFTSEDVDFFMNTFDCIGILEKFTDYKNLTDTEQVVVFTLLHQNEYPCKHFVFDVLSESEQKRFRERNRELMPATTDPYQSKEEHILVYESIGAMFNDFYCIDIKNKKNCYLCSYIRKIEDKWIVII